MSKKLFVGHMPYSMTKEEMVALFADYGEVEDARIIMDRMTGRSKGFGFVTLVDDAMADKAVNELNGKEVGGLALKVDFAKPMSDSPRRDGGFRDGGRGGYGGGRDRDY